jgi:hypothetical protein
MAASYTVRRGRRPRPTGQAVIAGVLAWGLGPPAHGAVASGSDARTDVDLASPAPTVAGPPRPPLVLWTSQRRAYLNRGEADGLEPGDSVRIVRDGQTVATCTVEFLSDHASACATGRAGVGDGFVLDRVRPAVPPAAPTPLPPTIEAEDAQRDARIISAAPVATIAYRGPRALATRTRGEVSAGYAGWFTVPGSASGYSEERIDALVHGMPLGDSSFRANLAFTARRLQRTEAAARFRPGSATQFYLWQAEVVRRDDEARTVAAAGRIWPQLLPGVPLLDGFQVGRTDRDHTRELGVYGGTLPLTASLAPTADTWTLGLYGSQAHALSGGVRPRLLREEVRVAVRNSEAAGLVAEGEGLAQAWLAGWNVAAGGLVRKAQHEDRPVWERGFLGVTVQAGSRLGGSAQVRRTGQRLADWENLAGELPNTQGTYHGSADAYWDFVPWLGLRAAGSVHHDEGTGLGTQVAMLELRLPRVWRDHGGLALACELGQGWVRSRTASLATALRLGNLARAQIGLSASSYTFTSPMTNPDTEEIAGHLNLEIALTPGLRVRARSLVRAPISAGGTFPDPAIVAMVFAAETAGSF